MATQTNTDEQETNTCQGCGGKGRYPGSLVACPWCNGRKSERTIEGPQLNGEGIGNRPTPTHVEGASKAYATVKGNPVTDGLERKAQMASKKPKKEARTCDVCGRPLPPVKGGHGRARERHKECTLAMSRIRELEWLVPLIRFMPPTTKPGTSGLCGAAKEMRQVLHGMSRLLRVTNTLSSTSDKDFLPEITAARRRK